MRRSERTNSTSKMKGEVLNLLAMSPSEDKKDDDAVSETLQFNMKDLGGPSLSIHKFAREGNVKMLQELLRRCRPRLRTFVNSRDAEGLTALHYAARYNHLEVVQLLVEEGRADVNVNDSSKATPLHFAARYRRQKNPTMDSRTSYAVDAPDNKRLLEELERPTKDNCVILYLVSKGAKVNNKDMYACSPLHYASMCGNEVAAQQLLMVSDIDIEATDRENMRPIHHACSHGHFRIAQILLDKGVDLLCRENTGCLPIHFICANSKIKILNLIIDAVLKRKDGSQLLVSIIQSRESQGNTPLHIAVKSNFLEGASILIKHGADVNQGNSLELSPLHLAAYSGSEDITHLLVSKHCHIDSVDINLQTPLHWAALRNQIKIIDYLVRNGGDVGKQDTHSQTPLLLAAANGKSEAVQKLHELGASIVVTQKANKSALYLAAENNYPDTALVILRKCSGDFLLEMPDCYNNTPLHVSCRKGHVNIVKVLLKAKAKINSKNEDVRTPLHYAAKCGHTEVIMLLLAERAGLQHLNDEDEESNTALHLASMYGHASAATALLAAGADMEVRNSKRWTALDCAAAKGHLSVAEVLIQQGSSVDPHDKSKNTPLYLACEYGHPELVELLLAKNASVSILTTGDPKDPATGCNPLDAAIDNSHKECARKIIHSNVWDIALRNQTRTIKGTITTPLRRLIMKMPDVAKEALDRCMKTNGMPFEHPAYAVTFDYEFLDDTYAHWGLNTLSNKVTEVSDHHHSLDPLSQDGAGDMEDTASVKFTNKHTIGSSLLHGEEDQRVSKHAIPYTNESAVLRLNHPLMIMVRSRREELLNHPVAVSLLTLKWRSYGRMVYYTNLLQYMVFLSFLTLYIILNQPPFYYYHLNGSNFTVNFSMRLCPQLRRDLLVLKQPTVSLNIVKYGVMLMAGFAILKELFQLYVSKHRYFDIENALEWIIYITSIVTVYDLSECQRETSIREPWQWEIGAFSIFMAWMNLVLFLRKVPTFGIFVVMFIDVFKTFIRFFVVFCFFLLAFAFAFFALLENQRPFRTFPRAIVKTWVMMTGELEYQSLFFPETKDGETVVHYKHMTYMLFSVFIVLMCVLIMNLLIGLAVDNIKDVQEHAALERLAMLVELGLGVEGILPHWLRKKFILRSRVIKPYEPKTFLNKLFTLSVFAENDEHHLINYMASEKSEFEKLQDSHGNIQVQVTSIESRLSKIEKTNDQLLTLLRTLVTQNTQSGNASRRAPPLRETVDLSFDSYADADL